MTKVLVRSARAKSSAPSPSSPPPPDRFGPLAALGFQVPPRLPTPETPLQDLLLYALTYRSGARPDLDMVLVVAAELEALSMFIEGPLHVTLGTAARRLRVAVDLAERLSAAAATTEVAA